MMPQRKPSSTQAGWPATAHLARARPKLYVHAYDDAQRGGVEAYIYDRYRQRFGARVRHWMPHLVSLQLDGQILAAAGFRCAQEPLFLERYLAAPIEQYLRDRDLPVTRRHIVETGQFASGRPGGGRLLVPHLARHLHQQGFEWAVGTLTSELHHLFSRMGLAHLPLAAAQASDLDEVERKDWGNYYQHDPRVFAGRLGLIIARFQDAQA
ncbi:thermostable hemolysin [Bordetella bronchiseptica]|uniref:thermostable hemolysin n=1 Tax=Bordetella bronchiseptica TaxID=518 RepID=UPI000F686233|nr:thermostable hemolysin [Bordetella bronchiseptica]RSB96835.1 thermostable hemolysin [Bordetella bronchiseptica]RSC05888.1 thermostable hemolysin [Bordetella bronchiseptica]